jgi:hypothetical protein
LVLFGISVLAPGQRLQASWLRLLTLLGVVRE